MIPKRAAEVIDRIQRSPQYAEEALRGEISEAIYVSMEATGVTRAELARRLKVSRATVTNMLKGSNNFEVSTLSRIAFALGVEWKIAIVQSNREPAMKSEEKSKCQHGIPIACGVERETR